MHCDVSIVGLMWFLYEQSNTPPSPAWLRLLNGWMQYRVYIARACFCEASEFGHKNHAAEMVSHALIPLTSSPSF